MAYRRRFRFSRRGSAGRFRRSSRRRGYRSRGRRRGRRTGYRTYHVIGRRM